VLSEYQESLIHLHCLDLDLDLVENKSDIEGKVSDFYIFNRHDCSPVPHGCVWGSERQALCGSSDRGRRGGYFVSVMIIESRNY
jgi:hypothetical protein